MAKIAALQLSVVMMLFLLAAMNQHTNVYHSIFKMYDEFAWSSSIGIVALHKDSDVNVTTKSTPERAQREKVDNVQQPSRRREGSIITENKKDLSDRLLYDSVTNTTLQPTSACIMFSDDNAWLPEWLAYHYYATGLRTLVVHIDQTSVSGPQAILNRWIPYFNNIIVWDRRDFAAINATGTTNITEKHTLRQTKYYKECALYLRNQSPSNRWTFFHDTDEFVTINMDVVRDATKRMAEPSSILRLIYDDKYSLVPKAIEDAAKSVSNANDSSLVESTETNTARVKCYLINRYLVTAERSTQEEIDEYLPLELNGTKLNTILYRNIHDNKKYNGVFKSLVDITHILDDDKTGLHHVSSRLCPTNKGREKPMIIKHYLGPWEMYNRENDNRKDKVRSRKKWKRRSIGGMWQPSVIQPWLRGFVDHVGLDEARYLLQGAGIRNNTIVY